MPDKSFSTFQVILIKGVFDKSIKTSLPSPEPLPSASALIKLPFSLEPRVHVVSPLYFFPTFNVLNSSSVKSKTVVFSALTLVKSKKEENIVIIKFLNIRKLYS